MDGLQVKVRAFHQKFGAARPVEVFLLDLVSEVGELAKAYLKATRYGEAGAPERASEHFAEEAGDALYSLLGLIEVAGLDAEALLEAALAKYRGRIEAKGTLERGVPHSQRE